MSFTALVADSTASLPPEMVSQYGIAVVPLYIRIDGQVYRDGVEITAEEFYERLPHCATLPTTSQPSAGDFASVYRELVDKGATGIISVHLSSGISGTVNSANLAAEQLEGVPVEVVDTRAASAAHRLALEAGAVALANGATMEEAVAAIQRVVDEQRIVFTVDTLEYLYKGGRIGGAAALVGSLLQFKPLLHFVDGKIDALERVRTSSKALTRITEVMAEWMGSDTPLRVMVAEAACRDRAQELVEIVRRQMNVTSAEIVPLTPVLGAHVGPGTLGLCGCPAEVAPQALAGEA